MTASSSASSGVFNAIFPNSTGAAGAVLTSTGTGASWTNAGWYTTDYTSKINERLTKIEERLLILEPNLALHEKYPALKEAYENYKLIEKLVNSQKDE